jgi:hypothetical protein
VVPPTELAEVMIGEFCRSLGPTSESWKSFVLTPPMSIPSRLSNMLFCEISFPVGEVGALLSATRTAARLLLKSLFAILLSEELTRIP